MILTDLSKCFGCMACVLNCKSWHTSSIFGPMPDLDPYGKFPWSMYFMRVVRIEQGSYPDVRTIPIPISCFHCENAPCVKVCPTGAIFKRRIDGVVVINYDICQGYRYCITACPYGNITFDPIEGVSKKCILCVDRLYDDSLPIYERIPACVRGCPAGSRIFGDLSDPNNEVSRIAAEYGAFVLGQGYGTEPEEMYLPVRGPGKGPFENEWELTPLERFAERTGAIDEAPIKIEQEAKAMGLTSEDLRTAKRTPNNVVPL